MNKMDSGGAERVVSILANSFAEKEIDTTILVSENKESFYPLVESIKYRTLNLKYENLNFKKRITVNFNEIRGLYKYFKDENPDLVISFIRNIPTIIAARLANVKVIISERNNPIIDPPNRLWRTMRPIVYPFANGIVFQSKGARNYFSQNIIKKSVIIPNPLDKKINEVKIPQKKNQIITVGRLAPQKDHKTLLKACQYVFEKFPNYSLVIYGSGVLEEELREYAENLNISKNVKFAGNTKHVFDKVAESKIFAFSSKYEGYPNSLIEAMAVGTAVVSTNCNFGPSEVIDDGMNGFLVEVGDNKKLADRIIRLIQDDDLNKFFGSQGLKLKQELTVDKISDMWLQFIYNTIEKK